MIYALSFLIGLAQGKVNREENKKIHLNTSIIDF